VSESFSHTMSLGAKLHFAATVASEMHWRFQLAIVSALTLSVAGSVVASAGAQPNIVSVHVQRKPSVAGNVHVSFHAADHLPQSGYYYAVLVLKPYKSYTKKAPPPCATSSDMQRTDYGYPHPGHLVRLALTPAKSTTRHWCPGATYIGGIYAVPHAPPCESAYPCPSEPDERSPCFEIAPGRKACGVVAQPKLYSYPEGLPKPLAHGTRIVGHFHVTF
jgi:hypothetical protein